MLNNTAIDDAHDILINRAIRLATVIKNNWNAGVYEYIIAGGALAARSDADIHDVDLFYTDRRAFPPIPDELLVCETNNARTYNTAPYTIQACGYGNGDLNALVNSFDFAHIQIGAIITQNGKDISVKTLIHTPAFDTAHITGTTWYTGSEYPVSSLIRAEKYRRYGWLSPHRYMHTVFAILADFCERGFGNYEDFMDQMDAVDLGAVPDDPKFLITDSVLARLFKSMLRKKGD